MTTAAATAKNTAPASAASAWLDACLSAAAAALMALLPFGTRYIAAAGMVAGVPVEWGTAGFYGTQGLAMLVIVLAWVRARAVRPWFATVAFALLFAIAFAGWWHGPLTHPTAWWQGLAVMLGLAFFAGRVPRAAIAWGLAVGGFFQAALGFGQFAAQAVYPDKWLGVAAQLPFIAGTSVVETADGRYLRAYGTLPHPNVFGMVCGLGLLAAAALAAGENGWRRYLAAATMPMLTVGLALSFSRSAWVGALCGAAAVGWLAWRQRLPVKRAWLGFAALVALTSGAVVVGTLPDIFSARLGATGRLEARSVEQRFSALGDARDLAAAHPWLGVGAGQMPVATAAMKPGRLGWDYQPVHLLPAIVLVELGVVGFAAWAALAMTALHSAWRRSRDFAYVGLAAAFVALLVAGLFDHYAWTLWPGTAMFFALMGATAQSPGEPQR
jgi:hypothetical protein